MESAVCKHCFYKYRTREDMVELCCHYNKKFFFVEWNEEEERYETTHCRPFPTNLPPGISGIAMCDPYKGTCRRDKCTFAHGREELDAWNLILWTQEGVERTVCKICFHRNRTDPCMPACPHKIKVIDVQWNDEEKRYETTKCRPFPAHMPPFVKHVIMCDPEKGRCIGKKCTFAHGRAELMEWNSVLKSRRNHDSYKEISQGLASQSRSEVTKHDDRKPAKEVKKSLEAQALLNISSPGISVPTYYSAFYEKFKGHLNPYASSLISSPTVATYKEKYHHLLCWEEKKQANQLALRCNEVYQIMIYCFETKPEKLEYEQVIKNVRYGHITSQDSDSLAYAKQNSQGSIIILDTGSYVYARHMRSAIPYQEKGNAIVIALTSEEHVKLEKSKFFCEVSYNFKATVNFQLNHDYFSILHRAIDNIPQYIVEKLNPSKQSLLSYQPKESSYVLHAPAYDILKLDQMQQKALKLILSSNRHGDLPILVAGPFGTGKTRLLATAAYEILKWKKSRVLICAHHHTSVDAFVEKYFGPMIESGWNMSVIRVIPNSSYYSSTRKKYEYIFGSAEDCSYQNYRLVLTTLSSAQKLYRNEKNFFTYILIDEGAQTREPEAISPLCLAGKNTTIVISGDHRQVGPRLIVAGEIPQLHGLGVSLLERLHALYDDSVKESCSATLLTNYRCHSGILMLPSSLYYQSTLLCRASDSPTHYLAPFPLRFVCSSICQEVKSTTGVDKNEASILISEVKKYFKEWPRNWNERDKRICIMSPSANQCSFIKTEIRKVELDCEVDVLTTYNIQGAEFSAVFISTNEQTDKNGEPVNKTKSICDRFVFNTVLTRSRSLVVAVGNPFSLLKKEESMIKCHDDTYKSWKPYIRQCIEQKTFNYANNIENFTESTDQLYECIYSELPIDHAITAKPLDTIISDYKNVFEQLPACKKAKLTLSGGDQLSWAIKGEEEGSNYETYKHEENTYDPYLCQLNIDRFRKAEAIPFDQSKKIVKISGLKNRKGAFDGDTVEIGVFKDQESNQKCYGRVIKAVRATNDMKFVCRILHDDPLVFYPIDCKNPKLINLPRLSRDLLKNKDRHNINSSDLKCTDVVVFDPHSYHVPSESDEITLPQIQKVIPISEARKMLFLVAFVKWQKKYSCPLGIVVGAYSKGDTPYNAERLLKVVHSVEYSSNDSSVATTDAMHDPDLKQFNHAFTIDPDDSLNLDDALSILLKAKSKNGCKVYELGVHIANAAKRIEVSTEVDLSARANGITVYGEGKGKTMHMISDSRSRLDLSLIAGKLRDTISVLCDVTITEINSITFGECHIQPSQTKSSVGLTYQQAQSVLDGRIPKDCATEVRLFDEDTSNPSLHQSIKLLHLIAKELCQRRKKSDAAFAYDVEEETEVGCWQTHFIVEELMIWANNKVAEKIHHQHPGLAVLRKQAAPNLEASQAIVDSDHGIMSCSMHLSQFLKGTSFEANCSQNTDIIVPSETLEQLKHALRMKDKTLLTHLLSVDRLYPQLVAVDLKFCRISLPAVYVCTNIEAKNDTSVYRHHSLSLDKYTHFTSPIRRYIDIEVQRLLLGISDDKKSEEQQKLCMELDIKQKNARQFERGTKNVKLAFQLKENGSEVFTASISQESKGFIDLSFADLSLKDLPSRDKTLKVANFIPFRKIKQTEFYLWKLRITSLQDNLAASVLKSSSASFRQQEASSDSSLASIATAVYCENREDKFLSTTELVLLPLLPSEISISSNKWRKMQQFVKESVHDNFEPVQQVLSKVQVPCQPHSVLDIDPDQLYPFLDCEIKSTLKEWDLFKVWLTWSTREPIISPAIQLVEVSPILRICLQHNTHAAECFSDPNLLPASVPTYSNIENYINRWKAVLLAEASEKSVRGCQPTIIQGVHLLWPKFVIPAGCIEQKYYVPSGSVKMRVHRKFLDHCFEFCKMGVGDLLCVRYGYASTQHMKAVYHFVVENREEVKERGDVSELVIHMESIGESNRHVSENMKKILSSEESRCEIQIIPLDYSYRKVYRGLKDLAKRPNSLSAQVAVDSTAVEGQNSYYKECKEVLNNDSLSTSIWLPPHNRSSRGHKQLNEDQRNALEMAIRYPFQLIQGPPGTGKSITGAHIAYVLAKANKAINAGGSHKCVLYCGPSNKSVDVVFRKFAELLDARKNLGLKILRIYSRAVERKDYPSPKYYNREHEPGTTCDEWAKPYALHHLLRHKDYAKELVDLEETVEKMKRNKKMASGKLCIQYEKLLKDTTNMFLEREKFDIVFCTCNEASGVRVGKYIKPRQCIIDECGMAYEPEAIVPISLCDHAVLIGDHKQLQPVIDYQPARDNGLTTSLFERCVQNKSRSTFLGIQYRMHESICEFPSLEFYEEKGGLETDYSVKNRKVRNLDGFWPKGNKFPTLFVNVVGEEGQEIGGTVKAEHKSTKGKKKSKIGVDSKYNEKEAKLVIKICKSMMEQDPSIANEIAVLTPYSAQKSKILEMMDLENLGIKVASITESQGDEYGYVILSTVRSQPIEDIKHRHYVQPDRSWMRENLGFIIDPHQINVAITRSKYGLIITGNQTLLEYNDIWSNLLAHYKKKGCIVSAKHFMD